MPRPATVGKPRGSSGSLFSRAITSLISIEGSDGATAEQVRTRWRWRCPELAGRPAATSRLASAVQPWQHTVQSSPAVRL